MRIDLDRLWLIAPRAQPDYKRAFVLAPQVFRAFEIVTALRARHFLAQVLHETGGLTVMVENLNYRAERLMQVWPARFPTRKAAAPYAHSPRTLANHVYGGRMGNVGPEDGWMFIGRGLLQITGRENYTIVGRELGIPLDRDPTLAVHPAYALAVAACVWKLRGCNVAADADDMHGVTRRINGGLIGVAERRHWLRLVERVIPSEEAKV